MQLLQKLLTTAFPTRNQQLHTPIIQNTINHLKTMHLPHGETGTSTLSQVHKLLHLPVMLQSIVDATKPLRGNHKGDQTWCYTRVELVSHRGILYNFNRFWCRIFILGARFTSASCIFASSSVHSTRNRHLMHSLNMRS